MNGLWPAEEYRFVQERTDDEKSDTDIVKRCSTGADVYLDVNPLPRKAVSPRGARCGVVNESNGAIGSSQVPKWR